MLQILLRVHKSGYLDGHIYKFSLCIVALMNHEKNYPKLTFTVFSVKYTV